MNTNRQKMRTAQHKVRVGDFVYVFFGASKIRVQVIEDRGPVGAKGRRILRVQTLDEEKDTRSSFEVPAAEVKHG